METAFNSQDQLKLIKIEHIFNGTERGILRDDFLKIFDLNLLIKWVGKLNKNYKSNFPLSILEFLCSIPILFNSSQKNNFPIVLSGDFCRFSGKFNNFSIFFKPANIPSFKSIVDFLKIPKRVDYKKFNKTLFLGIDLRRNNAYAFKIYLKAGDINKIAPWDSLMRLIVLNFDIDEILLAKKIYFNGKRENYAYLKNSFGFDKNHY